MRYLALGFAASVALLAVASPEVVVAQEGAAGEATSAYTVFPGDEIEIYVWGEQRLQRSVRVLPDGTLAFPLVGQIDAGGRTLTEIESIVTERLRPEYRGEVPRVTVSVVSAAGLEFSVMGRVNSPGAFTPSRRINLLEALAMAGGPSEFANLDDIVILRKEGDTIVPYRASVSRLFKANVRESHIEDANILTINPGDTIIVP